MQANQDAFWTFIPTLSIVRFMGKRGPKSVADRLLLITSAYPIYDDFWTLAKGGRRGVESRSEGETVIKVVQIPPEPDTVIALLGAESARELRTICRGSAWMRKQPNSYLSRYLPALAQQFVDARKDRHYPCSSRTTSIPKKFWFLARALAGAIYGLSPRRAINIIGPGKPEEIFDRLYEGPSVFRRQRKGIKR